MERAIAMTDEAAQPVEAGWNFFTRAYTHTLRREQREAIEDYTRALEHLPRAPQFLANRAKAYQAAGRYDEGLADARRAIEVNPDYMEGHRWLLIPLWQSKDTDGLREAMEALRKRAEGWRDDRARAEALAMLSSASWVLGEGDEARAWAERAIEADGDTMLRRCCGCA